MLVETSGVPSPDEIACGLQLAEIALHQDTLHGTLLDRLTGLAGHCGIGSEDAAHGKSPLWRRALRLTRDPVAADDLVQDTVVKAYGSLEQFCDQPEEAPVRKWLFTILNSIHEDRRKAPVKTRELAQFDEETWQEDADVYEGVSARPNALTALLDGAMADVFTPAQRDLVRHRLHEERSFDEIAELTGTKAPALRKQMSRIQEKLATLGEVILSASGCKTVTADYDRAEPGTASFLHRQRQPSGRKARAPGQDDEDHVIREALRFPERDDTPSPVRMVFPKSTPA